MRVSGVNAAIARFMEAGTNIVVARISGFYCIIRYFRIGRRSGDGAFRNRNHSTLVLYHVIYTEKLHRKFRRHPCIIIYFKISVDFS